MSRDENLVQSREVVPRTMVTPVRSHAKTWSDAEACGRMIKAISPQTVVLPGGSATADSSSAISLRGRGSVRAISIVPSDSGSSGMSRPLNCKEPRPGTDSILSQRDSVRGSSAGHPNLRVRRSLRADPHPACSGSVSRSGGRSGESRSTDSQPLRRRILCSDTSDDPDEPQIDRGKVSS